jgi:UPF0271 protein
MLIARLGDDAWRFPRAAGTDAAALLADLRAVSGVVDVVLSADHVLVTTLPGQGPSPTQLAALIAKPRPDRGAAPTRHVVLVRYDGPDLAAVAHATGLSPKAVIERHAASRHRVAFVGFLPGFAYLTGLPPELVLGRRDTPRARVPQNSVAIAGPYTGIYPCASPGGWHLVGTALEPRLVDGVHGVRFGVGDEVRFEVAR